MANEEKELYKFVNDPKYRNKVIYKVHNDMDKAYNQRISTVKYECDKLMALRINEINRIAYSRWENFVDGKLLVNRVEGKIRINGYEWLFSSIKGASLNMISGCSVITTEQCKLESRTKKYGSLGGAVAGGMIAGPVGAVVGGVGLGKSKTKTNTKGTTFSDQIPTCTHLGVLVNIDGFVFEIVLISSRVYQSSITYKKALRNAQILIAQLCLLSKTPVPRSFIKPEHELSVKNIDLQIAQKKNELQQVINATPVYILPQMYRTKEQKEMSDYEYLQYLQSLDAERETRKVAEKQKRNEVNKVYKHQREQNKKNKDYTGTTKNVGSIIYNIIFWILSVINTLMAIASFGTLEIVRGIVFLFTGVLINPKFDAIISDKVFNIPKWVPVIISVVGFLIALFTFSIE
jgi:hypothetical protein